ncbi:lasso RiPP family leader peptide-containing protein [Streptomyces sp. 5-10]|nr:lasso RiPP family leader peptide-containing protein [Streptomyces sp. 5-10]MBD3009043.1 lasso RiPP family leader peptide-containing protein [Streptomyces sp. 5-10]
MATEQWEYERPVLVEVGPFAHPTRDQSIGRWVHNFFFGCWFDV